MQEERKYSATSWAKEVAAALGAGWTAEPGHADDDARLIGPGGITLHAAADRYGARGRVELRWSVPDKLRSHAPYKTITRKEITVAYDKPAVRSAADITRRLLPGLAELLADLTERKAKSDAEDAEDAAYLGELAEILGEHNVRNDDNRAVRFGSYGNKITLSGDECSIELRLSLDRTRALAHWLAARGPE